MFDSINIQVIVTGVVGLITTITSGWFSWFLAKKKYDTEVDGALIANMQESLEFYTKLSDDNKARLDEAIRKNDQLEEANERLKEEVHQLREQVFTLMNNICYDMSCELRKKVQKRTIKKEKKDGTEATQEVH